MWDVIVDIVGARCHFVILSFSNDAYVTLGGESGRRLQTVEANGELLKDAQGNSLILINQW